MAQAARTVDAGVVIGQVFLGKYRVDSILGFGGMGVVAKCTHLGLHEHVAIKMIRQDVPVDHEATERFTREARAASKLRSEHVARVVDVGELDPGRPYMILEFLDGHDLESLLKERGTLQVPFAVMLMLQTAEALAEAHSISVVHRDIKPSNLFVTWRPDGSALVKVLDFGISKAPVGADVMELTRTQSLLGTPAYMSPEQMRSARRVDARSDVWSCGVVLYEMLEGNRPFKADSFSELCVKIALEPPEPMMLTPEPLGAVIMRCLAKDPEDRYTNMAELARDLLPHARDVHQATLLVERMQRVIERRTPARGTLLPSLEPGEEDDDELKADTEVDLNATMAAPSEESRNISEAVTVQRPHRRWPIVIAALVVFGAAVAGTFVKLRGGRHSTAALPTAEPVPVIIEPDRASAANATNVGSAKPNNEPAGSATQGSAINPVGSAVAPPNEASAAGSAVANPGGGSTKPKPTPRKPPKPKPVVEDKVEDKVEVVTPPKPECKLEERGPHGECPTK